jgi:hypothetical protein
MCERYKIDDRTEHYRLIATHLTDQALLDGIAELIGRLNALKAALSRTKQSKRGACNERPALLPR